MSRPYASVLAVLLALALAGCGGGGVTFTDPDGNGGGGNDGGGTSTGTARAVAGDYAATFSGGGVTGTGVATANADGTLAATLTASQASDAVARSLQVAVSTAGVVTGTATVGGSAYALTSGTLATSAAGKYTLTFAFSNGTTTETDTYLLTAGSNVFATVTNSGTDDLGGVYGDGNLADVGTATLSSTAGILDLAYTSAHRLSGATVSRDLGVLIHLSPSTTSSGSFTDTLNIKGSGAASSIPTTAKGTWTFVSPTQIKVTIAYTDPTYFVGTRNPKVNETLILTKS